MPTSVTARYYRTHKKAREVKKKFDSEYQKSPERVKYRVELNRERRKRHLKGDGRDLSHQKDGSMVLESRSKNRSRNGSNGRSTLK